MVNRDFAKWAVGFSGCDGGNLKGKIWLCGIEWGGGHTEEDLIFSDVSKPGWSGDERWSPEELKKLPKYKYNQKAAKLLLSLKVGDTKNYQQFIQSPDFFGQHSEYFKLNLYPIAFKTTDHEHWQKWITTRTGFTEKSRYEKWCSENRFPMFRKLAKKYCPALIVCTGTSYRQEFFDAFTDGESQKVVEENNSGKEITYAVTNDGKTLVAVTYFLGGQHGLTSDRQIVRTAEALKKICKSELRGG